MGEVTSPPPTTVVVGAGLFGITSAYFLRQQGHRVVVVERNADPAAFRSSSFANAGLLSVSLCNPKASPHFVKTYLKKLLPSIPSGKSSSSPNEVVSPFKDLNEQLNGMRVKWSRDVVYFGLHFLKNCTSSRFDHNSRVCYTLLDNSQALTESLIDRYGLNIHYTQGMLNVMPDAASLKEAVEEYRGIQQRSGLEFQVLDLQQTLTQDPSLKGMSDVAGSIYTPNDTGGNARLFTQGLEEVCRQQGVDIRYNVSVASVDMDKDRKRIQSITLTDGSTIEATNYVISAGSYTPSFFTQHKINAAVPILPMKGHSLSMTLPEQAQQDSANLPKHLMILTGSFTSLNRFGNVLRLTNGSDFFGLDTTVDPKKEKAMKALARAALPILSRYPSSVVDECVVWTGLRPMTPDSLPTIGLVSGMKNVFVSSGGGTLGWSMAVAAGKILADEVTLNHSEEDRQKWGLSTQSTDDMVPKGKEMPSSMVGYLRPNRFDSPLIDGAMKFIGMFFKN